MTTKVLHHAAYQSKLSLKKWSQTDKVYSRKVINGVPCSPLLSSQTLVTG